MPSGAGPGGAFLFSTVGRNRFDVATAAADATLAAEGLERVVVKTRIAAAAIVTRATHIHTLLGERERDAA